MTFDEWKKAAQDRANELDLPNDLWNEWDTYDLGGLAEDAHRKGEDPRSFVESAFEEDIARKAYDQHLEQESFEQMEDE